MARLLDDVQLGEHLDSYQHSLFRMETLPAYEVTDDGDDFHRWARGETEPTWARVNPWLDMLRRDHVAGRVNTRVRLLTAHLTAYERYSCEWGYALTSTAGEDIRVLRRGEHPIPTGPVERDYWVIDDRQVVAMHYDSEGRFEGAEILPDTATAEHLAAQRAVWQAAEPFPTWWARHRDLHRRVAA